MTELVFAAPAYKHLSMHLLGDSAERAAIIFTRTVPRRTRGPRLLVSHIALPEDGDYLERGPLAAVLQPAFVLRAVRTAQREGLALVFAHSHPFAAVAAFSPTDDAGERVLQPFLTSMSMTGVHAALVVARENCAARVLGEDESIEVVELGRTRLVRSADPGTTVRSVDDRQVRALGSAGQAQLQRLSIAVVGAGGTGSLVAQQLAHLGVRRITLFDPDVLDPTNLNRIVGATHTDVGDPKVELLARALSRVRPDVSILGKVASVHEFLHAREVAEHDFVFCCTDSHGSRAVLGQLAYQYLVPTIDMGVVIRTKAGQVTHITGRTHYLAPGVGCLVCAELLDPVQVRHDLMTDSERAADPYFAGQGEPQPAVIAFNAIVSASAVAMFLRVVTGVGTEAALLNYDGLRGTIRLAEPRKDEFCVVCSTEGALAKGDSIRLPARLS